MLPEKKISGDTDILSGKLKAFVQRKRESKILVLSLKSLKDS